MSATGTRPLSFQDALACFKQTHREASTQRDQNRELVPDDVVNRWHAERFGGSFGFREPKWVLIERDAMHAEVNRLRASLGKPALGIEALVPAEQSATGHVDYVVKFAIGCADLVFAD